MATSEECRNEYVRRIYRVQDYVEAHLDASFTLDELAAVAGFSKFHFHRIFKSIVHESLLQYTNRIRLEKAAGYLAFRPELTVTDIAYHFGFTDSAIFSRAFKNCFQQSPLEYRRQHSKNRKAQASPSSYNRPRSILEEGTKKMDVPCTIERLTCAEMRLAYARYTGTYANLGPAFPGLVNQILNFARENNLLGDENTQFLSIFHDNHEITKEHQLRTSFCMTLPAGWPWPEPALGQPEHEIGCMVIPAGEYAVGHFHLKPEEYPAAWEMMYGEWLFNSSFQPADSFPFELYVDDYSSYPSAKNRVDIYLPIEPLEL